MKANGILNRLVPVGALIVAQTIGASAADKLIGTKPPEWQVTNWFNGSPVTLEDLRGKVVLVRWWTAPECRIAGRRRRR
jgi:hypothetical protein